MAEAKTNYWDRHAETMPREVLGRLQVERIRACLKRMRASNIEAYRDRFSAFDPRAISSVEDLYELPFTTKEDLRAAYPFGLFVVPLEAVVRVHASSGSTGKPTVVGYTRSDLDLWSGLVARWLVAGGLGPGDVFQNSTGYGLFTGGLGLHDGAALVGATVVPAGSGNTVRQAMLMRDLGVTAAHITPSYALHVAEVAEAEGMDPRVLPLRTAFVGAEPMSAKMEREIERRLGVRVYEGYGLSEIIGPGVAFSCRHSEGLHVSEDHFIPEIVDPDSGRPLPEGEVGELVLSAPTKEALPLLRYRTRDLTRLTREPCSCGRTGARISKIVGRSDDMMVVRGVNVFPTQVEHALLGVDGLAPHYQILLSTRPDHQTEMMVRVERTDAANSAASPRLISHAQQRLGAVLGLSVPVELAPAGTIPRSEGKAVRVVDRRKEMR